MLNYGRSLDSQGSGFVINAGTDIQHTNLTSSYVTAMGFLKDELSDIKYALGYDPSNLPSGSETLLAKVGFFASGNIYFRNRYFADISYRTSGSSAYGSENRFAPMWSFGLGWNLHKEKFLDDVEWIDVMRLTWSWGYNGQTTGSPYQAITTYRYDNKNMYYTGVGTVPIRMGNPELKWQRVLKNNIGIDLTLFKERLVLSFDYFRNTTKDQLMSIPLPASTGAENITVNFGENQNTGYDFSVAAQIIRNRNWAWTSVINGSHVKDRIKRISNTLKNTSYQVDLDSPLMLRFREGGSQYDIYAVRSAGIDPATGQEIFIKKNGEYTFKYDTEDEVVVGNTQPKLQGTWLNTLRYKGWSLNFVFATRSAETPTTRPSGRRSRTSTRATMSMNAPSPTAGRTPATCRVTWPSAKPRKRTTRNVSWNASTNCGCRARRSPTSSRPSSSNGSDSNAWPSASASRTSCVFPA